MPAEHWQALKEEAARRNLVSYPGAPPPEIAAAPEPEPLVVDDIVLFASAVDR